MQEEMSKRKFREPKIINGDTYLPCFKCEQFKKLEEFSFKKRGKFGRDSQCKKCKLKYYYKYKKEHPEKIRKAVRKFAENNRESRREQCSKWRLKNPHAKRKWYRRTKNKITDCLAGRVHKNLNGNFERKKLWEILGYTYEEFVKHIEKRFQPGMTWENHGEWEIDHIIPIAFFRFKSYEDVEFKMCWRLENIQPLWKQQNKQKGNRVLIA